MLKFVQVQESPIIAVGLEFTRAASASMSCVTAVVGGPSGLFPVAISPGMPPPVAVIPVSKKKPGKKGTTAPSTAIDGPKSPEVLALENKVAEQGKIVRELKGRSPKTPELEEEIKVAVKVLKALKADIEKALSPS